MSQTLVNLFSIQRQVNFARNTERIPSKIFEFLLGEYFLSQDTAHSTEVKLSWLSTWRTLFEKKFIDEMISAAFTRKLKSFIVTTEDKFVIYEAQRVFVAMLRNQHVEEGVTQIEEILTNEKCVEIIAYYLEICRDLLSKQNPHCCLFLSRIHSALICVIQEYKNCSYKILSDDFLYQLITIFFKITKLANFYRTAETILLLNEIFTENCEMLMDILFKEDVQYYVKRKLVLTLYTMLRPTSALRRNGNKELASALKKASFQQSLNKLAEIFMQKINTVGFKNTIWKEGQATGFTGDEFCSKGDNTEVDQVLLREWSILCLGISGAICKGQEDGSLQVRDFISQLDTCIKNGLGIRTTIWCPWLPVVFGDQDDMWIDAMLFLMELSQRLSWDDPVLDNHWYFLQFVSTIGYDHLVLIDLLTSPETCFLDYLTSYLKYTLQTWNRFVECIKRFEVYQVEEVERGQICNEAELHVDKESNITVAIVSETSVIDIDQEQEVGLESDIDGKSEIDERETYQREQPSSGEFVVDISNYTNESLHKTEDMKCKRDCTDTNTLETKLCLHEETNDNIKVEKHINKTDQLDIEENCTHQRTRGTAETEAEEERQKIEHKIISGKSSGLAMIMDIYSDSDDEIENADDGEVRDMLELQSSEETDVDKVGDGRMLEKELMKVLGNINVVEEEMNLEKYVSSGNWLYSHAKSITPENTECFSETDKTNSYKASKTGPKEQPYDKAEHENTMNDFQSSEIDNDAVWDDENDLDGLKLVTGILSSQSNGGCGLEMEEEGNVMDRVMGMLIRVMLKLQRMWKHRIIVYNPQALIRLLEDVESMYTCSGK